MILLLMLIVAVDKNGDKPWLLIPITAPVAAAAGALVKVMVLLLIVVVIVPVGCIVVPE